MKTPVFLCFLDIKSAYDKVSYQRLFGILGERGVPKYLICMLLNWYVNQNLFVRWGNSVSQSFKMANGIRQGSCLSPHLFNVYVDKLNKRLGDARVGCHVAGMCVNNLSYVDDQVLITPDAKSINALLAICQDFAQENYVRYSITKTEAMLILPNEVKLENPPDILLNGVNLNYVDQFSFSLLRTYKPNMQY